MNDGKKLDVFFYEAFEEEERALRRNLPADIAAGFTWKTIQEQGDSEPPARLITIRTQSAIPSSWADQLDGILTRATGYDHLTRYLRECHKPIPCGHLPHYCSRAVAEQAMLFWMALLRRLPEQIAHFSTFNRDGLTGAECEHKKLLCVGVGSIGHEVVKIAGALGMEVRGVDIVKRQPDVNYVEIEEGISWADVIVCAMNLTRENSGYFSYRLFKQGKQGLIFINISRGELSPQVDLSRLLQEGHLGGVALDVYDNESRLAAALRDGKDDTNESLKATLDMARRPNVLLTPHNAFNTRESVARKASQSIQQIQHFLKHRSFLWPIPI